MKNIGEKTSSGLKRAGTVIKDTGAAAGTKISSAAHAFKVWQQACTVHTCRVLPGRKEKCVGVAWAEFVTGLVFSILYR